MDVLHRFCMIVAGFCLVAITLMIPWGVFTRYVLNSASSWPEPMAVLTMIWFSFLAAALCYRENLHIGVAVIPMMLEGKSRIAIGWLIEACMMGTNLFMFWWGIKLVQTTWYQSISDFPWYSVGCVLPAGADRRADHGAVRDRAAVGLELFVAPPTTKSRTISTE